MDDECWRNIFQYLTNYEKTQLTLVSRRWRYVAVRHGSFTTIEYVSRCFPSDVHSYPLFKNSFKMIEHMDSGRSIYCWFKKGLELPVYHENYKFPLIKSFMDDAVYENNHTILKQLEFPNLEKLKLFSNNPTSKPDPVPLPKLSLGKILKLHVDCLLPEYIPLLAQMTNLVHFSTRMELSLFDQYVPPSLKSLKLNDRTSADLSITFNEKSRIFQQIETFIVQPCVYSVCRKEWNIPNLKHFYLLGSDVSSEENPEQKYKFLQNIQNLDTLYASDKHFLSYAFLQLKKIKNLVIRHPWLHELEKIKYLCSDKVGKVFLLNCWRPDEFLFFHNKGFDVYASFTDTSEINRSRWNRNTNYNTPENQRTLTSYKKNWRITPDLGLKIHM